MIVPLKNVPVSNTSSLNCSTLNPSSSLATGITACDLPVEGSGVQNVPLLDVGRGNQPLKAEILESFSEIIDSGQFIGGPHVKALEESVAKISGAQFAIACASGSDALLLALMAIDIQPGDEVICPSFTFFATASAVVRLGATPVWIDVDPATFNLDANQLEGLITNRTKAVIPVHLFGQCCEMNRIMEIARRRGIFVIEDCAQAVGASFKNRGAGSIGDIGCFSFYPTKNLGGFGDGGMLTCNNEAIAEKLRLFANHGMSPRYYHSVVGVNSRLDAMQAAVLRIKLNKLDQYIDDRRINAENYQQLLNQFGLAGLLTVPHVAKDCYHVWNQFSVSIPDGHRDEVRKRLSEANIGSEIYYPLPLHQQECFADYIPAAGSLPVTDRLAREVIALPIFPELELREQVYVVETLAKIMEQLNY